MLDEIKNWRTHPRFEGTFGRGIAVYTDWMINRIAELEQQLEEAGFVRSADGIRWKPPVNKDAYAPKYFALEQQNAKLVGELKAIGGAILIPQNDTERLILTIVASALKELEVQGE